MWLDKGGPEGLGVVQGGFDSAVMKAKVESKKDKGGLALSGYIINKDKSRKNRPEHRHISTVVVNGEFCTYEAEACSLLCDQ